MADIKEFKPSTKIGSKPEEPADITTHEEFQQKAAEAETKRRNENPLSIEEIFELINEGKISKERLKDFEFEPDLQVALGWVIDLLKKSRGLEQTAQEQQSAIDQFEMIVKGRDKTIEQLRKVIGDLEDRFPPLGGA